MNDLNKWKNRIRAAKGIAVGPGGKISGGSWEEIRKYQIEFQLEHCISCIHFDPEKQDFEEKSHLNNPEDCKYHWTDIAGQCWNYREREEAKKAMALVQEAARQRRENPVIVLPSEKREQLEKKLLEYSGRLDPYKAPELQMDTLCKIEVLRRLLKEGTINTEDLKKEMARTYGSGFSEGAFLNACNVIEDYCLTGGANLKGGTGLSAI
jgi:hypothetical protein